MTNLARPHTPIHTTPRWRVPIIVRRILASAGAILLVALAVFLAWPSPINAAAWDAPQSPSFMRGAWAQNNALTQAEPVTTVPHYPEWVTFDPHGNLYTGDADGKIYRVTFAGGRPMRTDLYADTGGTPNGMQFNPTGDLIVADIKKGLLSVNSQGQVSLLTDHTGSTRIALADELDIAHDGTIYFTDSSAYGRVTFRELLEGRPHGRLLSYDPRTRQTTVLLDNLYFANGAVLTPDEGALLVVESYRYDVVRYWLRGPKAGTHDVFAANFPGFPDNISRDAQGHYWIALFTERLFFLDAAHRTPFLADTIAKIPDGVLSSAPAKYGVIAELDGEGRVVRTMQDPSGRLFGLTTALVHDGYVYLGTAPGGSRGIYRVKLPPA